MLKIDPKLLTVEIVHLKAVTTALGGSISVVDTDKSMPGKEEYKRIVVPMAVARAFYMKTKKISRYLKPVPVALIRYDHLVVAMERHPLGNMGAVEEIVDGKVVRWRAACEVNLEHTVKPMLTQGGRTWYFDGRYAYSLSANDQAAAVRAGTFLTRSGNFRKVIASCIDLQELSDVNKLAACDRSCLAFVTSNGMFAISPPIWKNLSDVGGTALKKAKAAEGRDDDDEDDDDEPVEGEHPDDTNTYNFDEIDRTLAVNLNFALAAGKDIGQLFGYEAIEPLQLDRMMIELHTTNLPNVPKQVKSTYDTGILFTHAMAWLLGMFRQTSTLDTLLMMRSLMKYLTQKGVFRLSTFNAANVFKDGATVLDVKKMDMAQLRADGRENVSISALLQGARRNLKGGDNNIHHIGGLLND